MIVFVNNKEYVLSENSCLIDLMEMLSISEKGLALAINQEVIPKNNWSNFELKDKMKVTLIRATQGG
jgi:sulfur carrier protein